MFTLTTVVLLKLSTLIQKEKANISSASRFVKKYVFLAKNYSFLSLKHKLTIVSTWKLLGNISTGCRDFTLNQSWSNNSMSLAMVVGLQEI